MNVEDIIVKKDPKIIFMGTPEFSVPILEGLIENYKVKAVVTQPDKQVGREGKIVKPPVKKVAEEHNILVLQLNDLKTEYEQILELDPDMIVTCAYGKILPKEILEYPRLGCINVHASLLPKLRGGAPIHRAILEGYDKTGITIMYMKEGMDDGDIISQEEIVIESDFTTEVLHDKLSMMGKELLLKTLPSIFDGTNKRIKQDESLVTYAPIIKPTDEKIDFLKSKLEVYNQIRGLNSWPGAYFMFEGKRIKVYSSIIKEEFYSDKLDGEVVRVSNEGIEVKVSNGVIVLKTLKPEGKKIMDAVSFANGVQGSLIGKIFS